jgi:hypothetical protein
MTNEFSLDFETISILEFPKNKIKFLSKFRNNLIFLLITHSIIFYHMESIEISSISYSSDEVDLSSDVSFADSTVTYEGGEFHRNDGTDSPGAWTNEHGPPTPEETTDDENECLCHEKMILDALQVEVVSEVLVDYYIICCQDYKVGKMVAKSCNTTCCNKFH